MNCNFGKYEIPPTFQSLIELENILCNNGVSLLEDFFLVLNFYFAPGEFCYFNTTSDVYGSVKDLEIAPIG